MRQRQEIQVFGVVQGVGFRPFVYRLARSETLTGFVTNTSDGVLIEVEGEAEHLSRFLSRLRSDGPPLARITALKTRPLPPNGELKFSIAPSRGSAMRSVLISPDISICDDCLRELFNPGDRRYLYPFINCTNCGPRYTIVSDIPYDRAFTSMASFTMCPRCQAEYDDPLNRRFHAQPNACPDCGPTVALWNAGGRDLGAEDPLEEAAAAIAQGLIVAVKGLGGFHLAVDAMNEEAVRRLRARKGREEKPFALMVRDAETAARFCEITPEERAWLESPQRPILLLPRKTGCGVAPSVAPAYHELALFLPYTPIHYLLFHHRPFLALVMTSGNISEEPIAIDNREAVRRLGGIADSILVHDRPIYLRSDDSVARVAGGTLSHLRRSRGFVPLPIFLPQPVPEILAVGGELKNTVCLTKGDRAFLSQHIGDLENLETYDFFEKTIEHLKRILQIEPQALACDLHPDYFSTRWAEARRDKLAFFQVQHHHAHIASCMAENGLAGSVIGLALDGTGYGTDGALWGGEALIASAREFRRFAHLEYIPLPGGAAAILEPWRMALAFLWRAFGHEFWELPIDFVRQLDRRKAQGIVSALERGLNAPLTSGCGRLFDAVSALLGICTRTTYEGQPAVELEMTLGRTQGEDAYLLDLDASHLPYRLRSVAMWKELVADLCRGSRREAIALKFHNALVNALVAVARRAHEETGLDTVVLSGGSFNNRYLFSRLTARLRAAQFRVATHAQVPAGDGGLALGQAVVAAEWLKND